MTEEQKQLMDEFLESWKNQRTMAREWTMMQKHPTFKDIGRFCTTRVTLTANHFYAIDELIRIYHQYQLEQRAQRL